MPSTTLVCPTCIDAGSQNWVRWKWSCASSPSRTAVAALVNISRSPPMNVSTTVSSLLAARSMTVRGWAMVGSVDGIERCTTCTNPPVEPVSVEIDGPEGWPVQLRASKPSTGTGTNRVRSVRSMRTPVSRCTEVGQVTAPGAVHEHHGRRVVPGHHVGQLAPPTAPTEVADSGDGPMSGVAVAGVDVAKAARSTGHVGVAPCFVATFGQPVGLEPPGADGTNRRGSGVELGRAHGVAPPGSKPTVASSAASVASPDRSMRPSRSTWTRSGTTISSRRG